MTTQHHPVRETIVQPEAFCASPSLHPEEPSPLCGEGVTKGGMGCAAILRDASLRDAPQDEVGLIGPKSLHPEEPRSGVTKGEGTECVIALRDADLRSAPQDEEGVCAVILRDASLRDAPQDEVGLIGPKSLHPEEPRSGVTKGEGTRCARALRDADLWSAPQGEERALMAILRDAMLRIAPQDEGRTPW